MANYILLYLCGWTELWVTHAANFAVEAPEVLVGPWAGSDVSTTAPEDCGVHEVALRLLARTWETQDINRPNMVKFSLVKGV